MRTSILLAIVVAALSFAASSIDRNNSKAPVSDPQRPDKSTPHTTPAAETRIATFLTFQDYNAENAMKFYMELFDNSRVVDITRWGAEGPGREGTIMHAIFELNGNLFMCSDSPPIHDWDFTPAVSNFVECADDGEIERLFERLSENGTVTMPLNDYGFSKKFGWVIDQYGVSWQLNLD